MATKGTRRDLGGRHVKTEQELAVEKNDVEMLAMALIRVDGGTQMRAGLRGETVEEYREVMELAEGWGEFPPIEVVYDGSTYWLTDGFHRFEAAMRRLGFVSGHRAYEDVLIPAKVLPGDVRFAIKRAMAANARHGLRRSRDDKRRAVMAALLDNEWGALTDGVIANMCAVTPRFVGNVRSEMEEEGRIEASTVRVGSDGRTYNVSNIGRSQRPPAEAHTASIEKVVPQPPREPQARKLVPEPNWRPVPVDGDGDAPRQVEEVMVGHVTVTLPTLTAIKLYEAVGGNELRNFLTPSESQRLTMILSLALSDLALEKSH